VDATAELSLGRTAGGGCPHMSMESCMP
jgi:hypothetical protein